MASLSVEEENCVRMSLLLKGVSPRAARTFFDSEFAPGCLDATIKKEYNKLFELKKKHIINQSQWNLLFTKSPDVPDSKTFDIPLMTLLLRNLTSMTPPLLGFDHLPSITERTNAADLARIKHYRNYLAHLKDDKIDTKFFNTAWNDITGAVDRLGGQQMKQECDHLKTKPLDQTNHEIMKDVKRSHDEMKVLKRSFSYVRKTNEIPQKSYKKMKTSHESLRKDHKKVTKEIAVLMTAQPDTIPRNIRAKSKEKLKNWKEHDDKFFIKTRAAQHVLKCIKETSCVTITASFGVGKTATLRHVALQMAIEEYDVLIATEPSDIVKYSNPKEKILFVFDNLYGNFSFDQSDIKIWDKDIENIEEILERGQTKILAACRLQVYLDEKFESISIFKSCECNLLSENMCLLKNEKQSIADLYLKTKASEITDHCNLYDCFPLLCKLYHDSPKLDIIDFFQNPFSVYEAEFINLQKKGHPTKYGALALCVMFNNKLKKQIFTEEVNEETRTIIENTCDACRLDRGTSRLMLQDGLESLKDTYLTIEQNVYKTLHDNIFDFLTYFFGQKIIFCLIKNADNGLIREKFLLKKKDHMDQFITIIPGEYHEMYIKRMIDDWSNGKVHDVFSNINMKMPQFRQTFLSYLKTLDESFQRQLAHICDKHKPKIYSYFYSYIDQTDNEHYDTALFRSCYIGDISMFMWCCYHEVDVNMRTYTGLTPVMIACKYGHTEIANMLLDRGLDCNTCDSFNQSMIMQACKHGRTEIVNMLLIRGADCNKCDHDGKSPIMKACGDGHTEIVQMLLDKGADFEKCDTNGQSAVMKACKHGHTEIVKMLVLDIGAEFNACDRNDQSPVMTACEYGHTEIVKMLLDEGADCNACTWRGQSSILKACRHGPTEIVKMLLDRGADCNKCDDNGQSPLMMACEHGHTEIVKMLLGRGVDFSTCDRSNESPVMKACAHGHTEIVTMLLDKGADFQTCDWSGQSPLLRASGEGHTEIVKLLLDRGADCNKYGQTPVMKASEEGHTEIVKMLLDRGDDCNRCDGSGQSSKMNMTGVVSYL